MLSFNILTEEGFGFERRQIALIVLLMVVISKRK